MIFVADLPPNLPQKEKIVNVVLVEAKVNEEVIVNRINANSKDVNIVLGKGGAASYDVLNDYNEIGDGDNETGVCLLDTMTFDFIPEVSTVDNPFYVDLVAGEEGYYYAVGYINGVFYDGVLDFTGVNPNNTVFSFNKPSNFYGSDGEGDGMTYLDCDGDTIIVGGIPATLDFDTGDNYSGEIFNVGLPYFNDTIVATDLVIKFNPSFYGYISVDGEPIGVDGTGFAEGLGEHFIAVYCYNGKKVFEKKFKLVSGFHSDNDVVKEISNIKISQNPVSNILTIEGLTVGEGYSIYDINGIQVLSGVYNSGNIDVSDLNPGVYLMKTGTGNNGGNLKFIKE